MGNNASCRGRVQQVKHFGLGNFARKMEFWNCINGNRRLHRHSLFTDKVQANHDGTNNAILTFSKENPQATVQSNFQLR
jgi:hypothetical protein